MKQQLILRSARFRVRSRTEGNATRRRVSTLITEAIAIPQISPDTDVTSLLVDPGPDPESYEYGFETLRRSLHYTPR